MPGTSPRPLHIVQVLEPSGGGSGRHFLDLCQGLLERGHLVSAIYSPVRAEARFVTDLVALGLENVQTVAMQRAVGTHDVAAWRHLRQTIERLGPIDIIHAHSSKAGALARLRLPHRQPPVIYTPHAFRTLDPGLGPKGRLVFGLVERLLGTLFSDRIICVSEDEFAHGLALGIPKSRLRLVVNGVAVAASGERSILRARFGIAADALVYGYVGRLSTQKAPERLIRAFAHVAEQRPEAHLLMVGSGPLETDLRVLATRLALGDRMTLTSSIEGPKAMQMFDMLVMPSRYEAMSYVMLEAEAAGLPMILTDVGGASTVVTQGENGVIIANDDDPMPLAAAMIQMAAPEVRASFLQAAIKRRDRHGLAQMVDDTVAVYREVLSPQT